MLQKKLVVGISLIIILIILPLILSNYIILLMCFIGIYTIAVSGLDILFGYSGQISIGHAAFYAIGAYTSAILSTELNIPVIFSMLIGAVLSAVVAIIIAYPVSKLVHHFLALATVIFGEVIYLIIVNSPGDITQGFSGYNFIPAFDLFGLKLDTNFKYYYLILFFCIVFLILKQNIVKSKVGRAFISIKENSHAADGMGVNVKNYKIMAFSISAFFTGFAGSLYAHLVHFISPETFILNQSIIFLVVLLFGGMGTFSGPIIGAIVITVINEILQVTGNLQTLIYGFFLLFVILMMQKGIVNSIKDSKFYIKVVEKYVRN